jgi:2-polyprenyl-3-methyl-5-hydroxy-6-metoxy-1,4-benzoquinol methylase
VHRLADCIASLETEKKLQRGERIIWVGSPPKRSRTLLRHYEITVPSADSSLAGRIAIISAASSKRTYAAQLSQASVFLHRFKSSIPGRWPADVHADIMLTKKMWQMVGNRAQDAIEAAGWFDSYRGKPFTPEAMTDYAENAVTKLRPYLNRSTRVLELACGSGLTMRQVAPHVRWIHGVDISQSIIRYAGQVLSEANQRNWSIQQADVRDRELDCGSDYDVVIINSFIQLLSSLDEVLSFISWITTLAKPEGVIFVGDIMDETRYRDLVDWVTARARGERKKEDGRYLYVPPGFFEFLGDLLQNTCSVSVSPKVSKYRNELSLFRYDTVIRLGIPERYHNSVQPGSQSAFVCRD